MWSGGALIQVSTPWCYFEVSLGYKKKQKEIKIAYRLDLLYSYIVLVREKAWDAGRINESYQGITFFEES